MTTTVTVEVDEDELTAAAGLLGTWRIDRGAVLAGAWRDHLERGLVWICAPAEMEICRRASKDVEGSACGAPSRLRRGLRPG